MKKNAWLTYALFILITFLSDAVFAQMHGAGKVARFNPSWLLEGDAYRRW